MPANHKIFNDPVYGFVSVPYGLIFKLVEHPYFQRLRRIGQTSLTHYVYPGALHTRFHHALGAFHLMSQAIEVLKSKGAEITDAEAEAVQAAILLHDIGHGPYSHTLESTIIDVHHERLSALFMEKINEESGGALNLTLQIFRDEYPKRFLHQLVSGQLDMDRLDYLTRDSFFTGVYEGVIGYDRIIKMLVVHEGQLAVEEKGIYSIEKFLIARRLMYWQVYLHKTVLAAEQMLVQVFKRAKFLVQQGHAVYAPPSLKPFLENNFGENDFLVSGNSLLDKFAKLDDADIFSAIKYWMEDSDSVLSFLSRSLVERRLFKLEFFDQKPDESLVREKRRQFAATWQGPESDLDYFILTGAESNKAYNAGGEGEEIQILFKPGRVKPMSAVIEEGLHSKNVTKYFICYPKLTQL
jgi:hypothetical protein